MNVIYRQVDNWMIHQDNASLPWTVSGLRNVSSGGRRPTAVHTHCVTSPAPQSRQWSVASLDRVTGLRHAGHCHVSRVTLCPCVIVMVRWCHLSSLVITFSDHRILGTLALLGDTGAVSGGNSVLRLCGHIITHQSLMMLAPGWSNNVNISECTFYGLLFVSNDGNENCRKIVLNQISMKCWKMWFVLRLPRCGQKTTKTFFKTLMVSIELYI